jgi:hypothetical protein
MNGCRALLLVFAGALVAACSAEDVPDNQSVMLCIAKEDWPKLISAMERFGRVNDLKLIGGVEPDPDGKPSLNVALAQGYNYYLGDDLDLWITSDPYRANVISYGAIGSDNPINHEQWKLARKLLRRIQPPASLARGTRQDPHCPEPKATQTPR